MSVGIANGAETEHQKVEDLAPLFFIHCNGKSSLLLNVCVYFLIQISIASVSKYVYELFWTCLFPVVLKLLEYPDISPQYQ